MAFYPVHELPNEFKGMLKVEVKAELLRRALEQGGGTAEQYVIREVVAGDKGSPVDFVDLDISTPYVATSQMWGFHNTDQDANDLANWLESQTIADNTWMAFFGAFDMCPHALAPITDEFYNSPMNGISRAHFQRGGGSIGHWEVEAMYAQAADDVVGFSDEPVFYDENSTPQIQLCTAEASKDKPFGLRGYLIERRGTINPVDEMGKPVGAETMVVNGRSLQVPIGGIEPIQEMTFAEITAVKERARRGLIEMAIKDNVISRGNEADALIMEPLVGDDTATNDVDIYMEDTQLDGHQMWAVDDDEITTKYDLGSIIHSGANYKKIADNTYVAIYGYTDNSCFPQIDACRFKISDSVLDFWQLQHVMTYKAACGLTTRPIFYSQGDPLKIEIRTTKASAQADYFPIFKAFVLMDKSNRIGGA